MENAHSKISIDLQYQTLYQEMRLYRNIISAVGSWYSTLLVILTFISRLFTNCLTIAGKWSLCFF